MVELVSHIASDTVGQNGGHDQRDDGGTAHSTNDGGKYDGAAGKVGACMEKVYGSYVETNLVELYVRSCLASQNNTQ